MAAEVPDSARAQELRHAVLTRYEAVARSAEGHFPYAVGRGSALALGYEPEWLERIPPEVVERFVGVGNPFRIRRPELGERVLDVGCGCGLDTFVAALLVGERGRAAGLDLSVPMLERGRGAAKGWSFGRPDLHEGDAAALPFEDGAFDQVISNGALNLVPDKDAVFRELHRVLAPGGVLAVADLLVTQAVPEAVLADMDAWST